MCWLFLSRDIPVQSYLRSIGGTNGNFFPAHTAKRWRSDEGLPMKFRFKYNLHTIRHKIKRSQLDQQNPSWCAPLTLHTQTHNNSLHRPINRHSNTISHTRNKMLNRPLLVCIYTYHEQGKVGQMVTLADGGASQVLQQTTTTCRPAASASEQSKVPEHTRGQ